MADNLVVTAGTGTNVASDEVTYSGDTAKLGIVRLVHVDGAEGAKTVKELVRLEDAAHTSGDPGIPTLTVRQDTAAALSGTDGDYQPVITDGSGRVHVNVGTSALPTGAATSAKQDTQITAEQAIQTSVELIDDTVRAEDVASGDGHKGVVMMAVRQDTPANTSGTDGDYEMPKMSAGRLWTSTTVTGTVTVDGSGVTQPVSNAGLTELAAAINSNKVDINIVSSDISVGGTAAADDADFTATTTPGTPSMGVYESTPTTVTDGDLGVVGITSGRRLKTSATIDAALPAGTNAIGKLAANSGVDIGDVDVTSCALPTGASTLAEQQTQTTALQLIDDIVYTDDTSTHATGTSKGALFMAAATPTDASVNANDIGAVAMTTDRKLHVAVMDALPAGTAAIGKLAANSGVDIGDVDVTSAVITGGGVADDATTPGNPIMVGGKAVETDGTDPTSVSAEDDVAIFRTDRNRRLLVNDVHPRLFSVSADYASAQTNASVKAAPGANLSLYITDIQLSNGATAGNVTLLDGSGGTVLFEVYPAVNGGSVLNLRTPIRLTANTALCLTSTTVTTHSIFVSGYIAP